MWLHLDYFYKVLYHYPYEKINFIVERNLFL